MRMAVKRGPSDVLEILKNGQFMDEFDDGSKERVAIKRLVNGSRVQKRDSGSPQGRKDPVKNRRSSVDTPVLHTFRSHEKYSEKYVNSLVGVLEGTLTPDEAQGILVIPLRELLEEAINGPLGVMNVDKTKEKNMEMVDNILNGISKALLLSILFIGKSKTQYRSGALEDVSSFLYKLSMMIDMTMERLCNSSVDKVVKNDPENPKMLLHIWTILLSLVYAKDKKLRLTFCTIAFHIVRTACIDEIMITSALFEKHVQTFTSLLSDQNKDIRCLSIRVLESFQTPLVVKSILPLLNDPHHSVRLAVLENLEPPEDHLVYQTIILRCSDESKDVRIGAYRKLAKWYLHIPLEHKLQILSYGLSEEDKQTVYEFYKLISEWIRTSGSLFTLVDGFIDKVVNMDVLENVLKVYMERSAFLEDFKAEGYGADHLPIPGVSTTHCNAYSLLHGIKTATPSELFILSVFFQNFADATHKEAIPVLDIFSYLNALVSARLNDVPKSPIFESLSPCSSQNMPLSQDVYYSPRNDEYLESPPLSQDVLSPQFDGIAKYDELHMANLQEMYVNDYLLCNTLRSLLIIAKNSQLERHMNTCELVCNKILLHGPVRSLIGNMLSNLVVSTSLGDNSFLVAQFYGYLENSYIFHALSLLRRITLCATGLPFTDDGLGGAIPRTNSSLDQFETLTTHKILALIGDVKDPFQTSGIDNVRIGKNELERISKAKIKRFNVSKYSIEHLNVFVKSLDEQLETTRAAIGELETLLHGGKSQGEREDALKSELDRLSKLLEKQELFISILQTELKERWSRILIIVESFLALTRSKCSNDPGLQEFPQMILLPQLSFFSSTVIEWKNQDLCDEYCDILSSKCLGGWSLLNQGHPGLTRQINAFYTAFKESHDVLVAHLDELDDSLATRQRIELQTLRCEMYLATIVDLLITNVELRDDCLDISEGLWDIVNVKVVSTKYVQSVATRLSCKLAVVEFFGSNECPEERREPSRHSVDRLRGLLEIAFILPTTPRTMLSNYKFTKSTTYISFTPEDKHIIRNMACLYPTLSYRHLKTYHKAFEYLFTKSLHSLLGTSMPLTGFSLLIIFTMQLLLKAPLHFISRKYTNYIKWLLLVTIDEGNVMYKMKVASLIHNVLCMYIKEEVPNPPPESGKTLCSICAHENVEDTLLDLRDIRLLILYILKDGKFLKARANVQTLKDALEIVDDEMKRVIEEHGLSAEPKGYTFKTPDDAAFASLIEAYDSYITSIGERECASLVVPRGSVTKKRCPKRTYDSSSESIASDYSITSSNDDGMDDQDDESDRMSSMDEDDSEGTEEDE